MEKFESHKYVMTVMLVCISFGALTFGMSNLDAIKHPNGQIASISVSGDGEVTAIPDIAAISFTVRESAKTVPEAQKAVEAKIVKATADIAKLGVATKDIKTTSYIVNPKYESQPTGYCSGYVCPPGKTVITGYEVAQSMAVKVRKVDTAGAVIGAVGAVEISEISGPDFTVDDMDKVQADAKALAIKKAQEKAEVTAKALGVSLGAITQFNEDNGGYSPVMFRAEVMSSKAGGMADAVTLPQGESVIKSRVTITYSLK